MRRQVLLISLLVFSLLFVGIISCTNRGNSSSTELRIGYIPIIDTLPLYVAVEKGYFAEQGLKVSVTPMNGGPMILEALGSGNLEIGFSNVVTLLVARSKGLQFQTVGAAVYETDASRAHALLVRDNSPINSPADLNGKRIAINAQHNIDQFVMNRYLEMNGLPYNAVSYYEVPHAQMEALLAKGEVDATISVEPYLTSALTGKGIKLLDYEYTKVFPTLLVASYIAPQEWLQKHGKEIQGFQEAMRKAREFVAQHESEARSLLPKYTRIDEGTAAKVRLPVFKDEVSSDQLQMINAELLHQKLIDHASAVEGALYGGDK
ncbi:MAG TPA: ABC transporter substrate-binding protein [Blastocatellia bacterium]|nr:ABC transporter substrate-binding protein [Blastocatellia bacterium]